MDSALIDQLLLQKLGRELFRTADPQGPIVVHQEGDRRTLTFGNEIGQSSLSITHPERLEYAYTQGMFLATLLVARLRTALVLGTGGGSLVRALAAAFPDCRITAVEAREQVIQVAKEWFFLTESDQVNIVISDAADYLPRAPESYDLIFADLYLEAGMDERQMEMTFLHDCRVALAPGGVLAANFWSRDLQSVQQTWLNLSESFGDRVLQLPVRGGNLVAFGCADQIPQLGRKSFYTDAERLGTRLDIPLEKLAHNLWRQNAQTLKAGRYQR